MLRFILGLVGAVFSVVLLLSFFSNISTYLTSPPEKTAEEEFHLHPKHLRLASDGPMGHFDRKQLQRGFQVYKEVCSACHSLSLVAFRDLEALGYNEAEVKAIAEQWATEVPSINPETGEPATRKALPADRFPSPYANEIAARAANNNALPPDLSLMTKARHDGPAYVYSLLTGYQKQQPAELLQKFPASKTPQGLHYNPYFANLNLAMPAPLTSDGQVTYAPGNPAPTVDQMAKDVAAFLVWTAEPKLEKRHATGLAVTVFLLFATILGYLAYRNIWANEKRKVRVTGVLDPENQAKTARARRKAGVKG
jgi:ubiquinol-cytochrome c reductase cytochrome c1 subunit